VKPDGTEREADRRRVTVLFADLSGFTALSGTQCNQLSVCRRLARPRS
jgi:class 3 adenylate cyclase